MPDRAARASPSRGLRSALGPSGRRRATRASLRPNKRLVSLNDAGQAGPGAPGGHAHAETIHARLFRGRPSPRQGQGRGGAVCVRGVPRAARRSKAGRGAQEPHLPRQESAKGGKDRGENGAAGPPGLAFGAGPGTLSASLLPRRGQHTPQSPSPSRRAHTPTTGLSATPLARRSTPPWRHGYWTRRRAPVPRRQRATAPACSQMTALLPCSGTRSLPSTRHPRSTWRCTPMQASLLGMAGRRGWGEGGGTTPQCLLPSMHGPWRIPGRQGPNAAWSSHASLTLIPSSPPVTDPAKSRRLVSEHFEPVSDEEEGPAGSSDEASDFSDEDEAPARKKVTGVGGDDRRSLRSERKPLRRAAA